MAALCDGIAAAPVARGDDPAPATLTASAAVVTFQLAATSWLADPRRRTFGHHLLAVAQHLHRVARTW